MANKRTNPKGYKTVDDAAEEIGVSVRTLWRWIKDRNIATVPNASYMAEEDIERLKQERSSQG